MNQSSLSENLIKALEMLPNYLVSYVVGFFIVAITDVTITSLVIGAVLLGFLTSPLIALVVFFFLYVGIRAINSIANSIGTSVGNLAAQVNFHGQVSQNPLSQP